MGVSLAHEPHELMRLRVVVSEDWEQGEPGADFTILDRTAALRFCWARRAPTLICPSVTSV
jgi:hypothetical protein